VEANDEYFPSELKQEKLRKNAPISYEEKFNLKNKLELEKFYSAKEKSKGKENKNLNKKRGREAEDLSRKDSLLLASKKNEKNELNEDHNNRIVEDDNNNENIGNLNDNNNNKNKKNNKIVEDDDQSEKEESNQDDQSFDEFMVESEENLSNDVGSENDERDYSDGGVF